MTVGQGKEERSSRGILLRPFVHMMGRRGLGAGRLDVLTNDVFKNIAKGDDTCQPAFMSVFALYNNKTMDSALSD